MKKLLIALPIVALFLAAPIAVSAKPDMQPGAAHQSLAATLDGQTIASIMPEHVRGEKDTGNGHQSMMSEMEPGKEKGEFVQMHLGVGHYR